MTRTIKTMSVQKANNKKQLQSLPEEMRKCYSVLEEMQNIDEAYAFLEPVDWEALGLPDYPSVIKRPMDMNTIEEALLNGEFSNPNKFAADMRLVFKNAQTYNRSDSDIFKTAEHLAKQFEKKFSKYFKAEGGSADGAKSSTKEEKKDSTKKKSSGGGSEVSRQERVKFSQMVNQLTSPQLGTMVNMIQKECPEALNEDDEDELEIEINNISGPVLLQLIEFASNSINQQSNKRRKK